MTLAQQKHDLREIAALLDSWNAALDTRDARTVAALYAPDAILMPTVSNQVRKTPAAIRDYFTVFLKRQPHAQVLEHNIRLFEGISIDSGIYVIHVDDNNVRSSIMCRYTFVYRWGETGWKIIEHHSSAMPEAHNPASIGL
ncbi:SgcJ/EcaC family oxidoreductase [Roseinatronobacter sp. NSM]|uniref:SgcJ/EcaC family oxidoreductase n=1 Tax=Roseinatronobacter sp. NSM TaxID=3457785 RepID=UPI004035A08A